jgi:hypothetical protein
MCYSTFPRPIFHSKSASLDLMVWAKSQQLKAIRHISLLQDTSRVVVPDAALGSNRRF